MSYCGNCGTNVPDNAEFCPNCGQKIDVAENAQNASANQTEGQNPNNQPNQATNQNPYQTAPNQGASQQGGFQYQGQPQRPAGPSFFARLKTDKKLMGICIGALAALVVIIGLIVWRVNASHTVDLTDYYTVEFDGADTAGTASVSLNETALYNALTDAGGRKVINAGAQYSIMNSIEAKVTPDEDLSNGDKVTLTISFNKAVAKQYGIKLKGKSKTFKVSGLKEVEEIDPFDYITVSYTGVEPNIYVEIEEDSSECDLVDYIYYDAEPYSGLSVGDEFTITADVDEDYALSEGYKLTKTEKTYTVDGGDSYISSMDDIDEDTLATMKSDAEDEITAELASASYTVSDQTYIGSYLLSAKNTSSSYYGNTLYLVYQATANDNDGEFSGVTVYMLVEYTDVIKKGDGTITYDDAYFPYQSSYIDDAWSYVYGYTDGSEMYNDIVTSNVDDYTATVTGDALKAFGE